MVSSYVIQQQKSKTEEPHLKNKKFHHKFALEIQMIPHFVKCRFHFITCPPLKLINYAYNLHWRKIYGLIVGPFKTRQLHFITWLFLLNHLK
jgi:hypothetical protein